MKNMLSKTVAVILVIGLSGCAELGIRNETGGALAGGAGGGLLGYGLGLATGSTSGKVILTLAGTLLGAYLGSRIGKNLDRTDKVAIATATQNTLEKNPSGKVTTWRNPDSEHSGTVVAKPAFKNEKGQYCREFTQTFNIDGETKIVTGTACRQPDGTWKIVS